MSIQSAAAFIEKIKNDEDFKKKLGEFKTGEERIKYAKTQGFDFTPEDIKKVKEEQGLTDEELDSVAGGGMCFKVCAIGHEAYVG